MSTEIDASNVKRLHGSWVPLSTANAGSRLDEVRRIDEGFAGEGGTTVLTELCYRSSSSRQLTARKPPRDRAALTPSKLGLHDAAIGRSHCCHQVSGRKWPPGRAGAWISATRDGEPALCLAASPRRRWSVDSGMRDDVLAAMQRIMVAVVLWDEVSSVASTR